MPTTLGVIVGNRDFVVTLECFDDLLALYPSGQTFDVKGRQDKIDEAIVRAVVQLISRRQASRNRSSRAMIRSGRLASTVSKLSSRTESVSVTPGTRATWSSGRTRKGPTSMTCSGTSAGCVVADMAQRSCSPAR